MSKSTTVPAAGTGSDPDVVKLAAKADSGSILLLRVTDAAVRVSTDPQYSDEGVRAEPGDRVRVLLPEGERLLAVNDGRQDAQVETDVMEPDYDGSWFIVQYGETFDVPASGVRADTDTIGGQDFDSSGNDYEVAGPATFRAPSSNASPIVIDDHYEIAPGEEIELHVESFQVIGNSITGGDAGDSLQAIVEVR